MFIAHIVQGQPAADGAGVSLTRLIGTPECEMVDPFVSLSRFGSDDPDTFMAGFPDHPHRGFETVTIMLDGLMRHRDSQGNNGIIGSGGIQWMTAGRGIIHSEMPEAPEGRLDGFQLWVNLPAQLKMTGAGYQDIDAEDIPIAEEEGARICVVTGTYGEVVGPACSRTPMRLLRIVLASDSSFRITPAAGSNVFACVYEGELRGPDRFDETQRVPSLALAVFHGEGEIRLDAGAGRRGVPIR